MKNLVEALLEDDHESLGHLLSELNAELTKRNLTRAFDLLDLFWARLAVHIRAENLHLFPALANSSSSLFTGSGGSPTYTRAQSVLAHLRSDHDFFMKELATMIKVMRDMVGSQQSRLEELENLRRRLAMVKERLDDHNRLEEEQVYVWPSLLFDDQMVAGLCESLRQELENLPPRFG
jgi:iron-sulfur cluster repair protein YtfE (RIC family)